MVREVETTGGWREVSHWGLNPGAGGAEPEQDPLRAGSLALHPDLPTA